MQTHEAVGDPPTPRPDEVQKAVRLKPRPTGLEAIAAAVDPRGVAHALLTEGMHLGQTSSSMVLARRQPEEPLVCLASTGFGADPAFQDEGPLLEAEGSLGSLIEGEGPLAVPSWGYLGLVSAPPASDGDVLCVPLRSSGTLVGLWCLGLVDATWHDAPMSDRISLLALFGGQALHRALLEERPAQLPASSRALREVAGIIAHDLRNSLSAIMLCAEMLHRAPLPAPEQDLADRLQRSSGRMRSRLHDALDYLALQTEGALPISRCETDLALLCRRAIASWRGGWPKRTIAEDLDASCRRRLDAERIRRVVETLLGHALRHGDDAMPVTARCRAGVDDVEISVSCGGVRAAERARPALSGQDTGGPGLALLVAHHIARAHGGDIAVHVSAAEGTHFTMRLPDRPGT